MSRDDIASLLVVSMFLCIIAMGIAVIRCDAKQRAMSECLRRGSTAAACKQVFDP